MRETPGASRQQPDRYEAFYRDFEMPLMQAIRRRVYGQDTGLHSWGTIQELWDDLPRLNISRSSCIADLGCGPCGALTSIVAAVGCHGTGVDRSASALLAGQARAASMGLDDLLDVQRADLDRPLPFADRTFQAILAIDVIPHLHDRQSMFREVARLLRPGGRFLCTDSCVLTGSVSTHELHQRLTWGYTQLAVPGWNECLLEESGLRVIESQNRTVQASHIAELKAAAYQANRVDLEQQFEWFEAERFEAYLESAALLFRERRMSRIMVLAVKESDS